jgi:hypothetical protein
VPVPPYFPDTPKVRTAIARMYTNIEKADAIMGELLDQLEEDGLAENTIVMHWSDHGPMPRGKRWPYDSGIRVPMIVRWPGGLEPDTTSDRLINTLDLAPTVLSLAGVPVPWHMQGVAFLGEQEGPPRDYAFAARDRYDESYDMIRAARDKRFKYIRHYHPELPYLLWIPYRNRHPILQEMWRLHMAGELEGAERLMFEPRPVEELYDTEEDPWEINNLAGDPAYLPELQRMRDALDDWRAEVGDMGEIDEAEMVKSWYPDAELGQGGRDEEDHWAPAGGRPRTASPIFIPISEGGYGREAFTEGTFPEPCLVQLHCATQGASIAWTTEEGHIDEVHWNLYTEPLRMEPGTTTLRARAVRIGHKHSEESVATITVE